MHLPRAIRTAVLCAAILLTGVRFTSATPLPPFPFPNDFAKSLYDVTSGILRKLPDTLPSPEAFFSTSKNLVAGYPIQAVLATVNHFCATALAIQSVQPKVTPNQTLLNFFLMTPTANYSIPLRDAHRLWNHPMFNRSLDTEILITGWTTNINKSNSALETVSQAFLCRGGVNFVVVDTAQYIDTLYEWAAFNTEGIGNIIATGLKDLVTSYPLSRIHLIGHSLGAHIASSAGRNFYYETDKLLPHITGLDPANPCFNEGQMLTGLSRGDAEFVDVIHSNSGALGKRDPMGDVDFYPNGVDPLPPGCFSITCAHSRAFELYAESVLPGNEEAFMGVKCGSMFALNSGFCPGKKFPMGYATPRNLKGNYFLKTGEKSPFGEGSKAIQDVQCQGKDISAQRTNLS